MGREDFVTCWREGQLQPRPLVMGSNIKDPETEALQKQQDFMLRTLWQDPAVSCNQVTGVTQSNKES